tara:strand:+ start:508 stop:1515 length:1008 start_codon:yes stop_codon:yes gene_type:complete
MPIFYEVIIFLIIIFSINYIVKNRGYLIDNKYSVHKSFSSKDKVPLTGGIFFFLFLVFYFPNYFYLIFFFLIFLIGMLSDLNYVASPLKRIIFQILVITSFIIFTDIYINSIRIEFFDNLLENIYFKIGFTLFCYLILINGSNFIDGMNSLLLGYFTSILIVLFLLANFNNLVLDFEFVEKAIICLLILFFLNMFGVLFVGDNGAYLISILVGYILINFSNENSVVSPYFIAVLLWYPAYENLFSIIRKKVKKFDAFEADNKHIHQILFKLIQKKTNMTKFYCNNITSIMINLFNATIFYFAFINFSHTKNLIFILILSLFSYSLVYFYLRKKNH